MQILVTGAGGFSGSHLVKTLLDRGHQVSALVGRSRGRLDPAMDKNPSLTVAACDLAMPRDLPKHVDAIVHAAARSPAPGVSAADMVRDNTVATANMVAYAAAAGAGTFIYLSSLSIYGEIAGSTVDEATPIANPDAYGMTKFLGELLLRERAGLRSLSIRLPGVVGPNSVRNWLTSVIERGRAGQEIAIYNPDAPFNNAIHVDHLSLFIADVIERQDWNNHDAVTVGADRPVTVREAVDTLLNALGSASRVSAIGEKGKSFLVSNTRAQLKYGYIPAPVEDILCQIGRENRVFSDPSGGS